MLCGRNALRRGDAALEIRGERSSALGQFMVTELGLLQAFEQ